MELNVKVLSVHSLHRDSFIGTKVSQEIGITTVCADSQFDNCGDREDVRKENIKEISEILISIGLIFLTEQMYFA